MESVDVDAVFGVDPLWWFALLTPIQANLARLLMWLVKADDTAY